MTWQLENILYLHEILFYCSKIVCVHELKKRSGKLILLYVNYESK